MTYEPRQRAHDRVDHQPRLVGEEGDAEADLGGREATSRADAAQVAALGDAPPARQQPGEDRQRRRAR